MPIRGRVVRHGLGEYTVFWSSPMPDASYPVIVSPVGRAVAVVTNVHADHVRLRVIAEDGTPSREPVMVTNLREIVRPRDVA